MVKLGWYDYNTTEIQRYDYIKYDMQTSRNIKQNKEEIQNGTQKKYQTKRLSTCGWAGG